MADQDLRAVGDRIERLIDELHASVDHETRARIDEVVGLVTQLYGAGLARIVALIGDADSPMGSPAGGPVLARLLDDDLVASLLVLHGLHPDDLADRVEQALEGVRPYLATHGGNVELLGVDDEQGAVLLRLLGSCDGCPSSSVTLKLAVERAIEEAAPEVTRIVVEPAEATEPAAAGTPIRLGPKPDPAEACGLMPGGRASQ
jgi:Fe-S cluster biogenesis protein NfuA